ncbi:MAG: hypothetical protein ACKVWV_02800 [Planctomycetota bacterium]
MRLYPTSTALSLIAALFACTAAQSETPDAKPVHEPTRADAADPMASFARMVGREWKMTALAGTSTYDTWHWGPSKHSTRVMTDGSSSDLIPEPWRGLQVFYWHPGRKQVCTLGLSPYDRGVSEGTIQFDGETADGVFDLYQTSGRRKMGLRWTFDGPDKYHDILLEETGPAGLEPVNGWDHFRSDGPPAPRATTTEKTPEPSAHPKVFGSLFGRMWESKGDRASGDSLHFQTTFEYVPYADGIYVRVIAPTKEREPTHLLDAYLYHHTGMDKLRCLALSNRGGVHEGDVTVLDGGAVQLDLKGYEGDEVVPHVVRFDLESDGTLRSRVWSLAGSERTLLLDVHHKELATKKR